MPTTRCLAVSLSPAPPAAKVPVDKLIAGVPELGQVAQVRGEPSPANLRAAKRLADHRKAQKVRLSDSAEAEDFIVSRQVRRHMMRIAAKFDRTERKEEAMSSRAMGGAAAVV